LDDLLSQGGLLVCPQGYQGPSVPHGELLVDDGLLNGPGQSQQSQRVGHSGATAAHSPRDFLLSQLKLLHQELVGVSLLDGAQVIPLDIFHQRQRQQILIRDILNQRGDALQSGFLSSPPAPLARHDLVPSSILAHHDRLQHPVFGDRCGQLLQLLRFEAQAWLKAVGSDLLQL
jgi:hypothetical protein